MPQPSRRPRRTARFALVATGLLLCTTCNYGEVVVVQPAAQGRGPLTLSIQADPEDAAPARELGWSAGIPGAEVTVSPANADTVIGPPVAVLQTDNAGRVSIADLPDGHYLVEVRRLLTAEEMARLAPSEDVVGFMANTVVERGSDTVLTPASHRRSIVISEWAFNDGWIPGVGEYYYGGYLELANNSDTTVYLDGLVVGDAYAKDFELHPGFCAASEFVTSDPVRVWSRFLDSVPGTGRDHPLPPGATVVLATDGIDHSEVVPGGLDLSHADFEFIGDADVDNPGVPNLLNLDIGHWRFMPHGLVSGYFTTSVVIAFVALPLDIASLPMTPGHDYVGVPRDRILDVVASRATYLFQWAECPHIVHPNFDRHPARFMTLSYKVTDVVSGHRRVAYTRPDGRKILQHTRSGITDFYLAPRTPWQLP